jgi:hypothetical protein
VFFLRWGPNSGSKISGAAATQTVGLQQGSEAQRERPGLADQMRSDRGPAGEPDHRDRLRPAYYAPPLTPGRS